MMDGEIRKRMKSYTTRASCEAKLPISGTICISDWRRN
jgi:hypothetical protein